MFRDVRSEMPFVVSAQAWLQSARWHRWGSDALGVQQTVHINSAWPDMPGLRAESQAEHGQFRYRKRAAQNKDMLSAFKEAGTPVEARQIHGTGVRRLRFLLQ